MTDKERRSAWFSTMSSIHYPFTSARSYVVDWQGDMRHVCRENSEFIDDRSCHVCSIFYIELYFQISFRELETVFVKLYYISSISYPISNNFCTRVGCHAFIMICSLYVLHRSFVRSLLLRIIHCCISLFSC